MADNTISRSGGGFQLSTEVILVDIETGVPTELSRVADIRADQGDVGVEGYTARFALADGKGLPTVETRRLVACEVLDLRGSVVRDSAIETVVVRTLPARFDIRPATAENRRATVGASAAAGRLADSPVRAARRGKLPPPDRLRRMETLMDDTGRGSDRPFGSRSATASSPLLPT